MPRYFSPSVYVFSQSLRDSLSASIDSRTSPANIFRSDLSRNSTRLALKSTCSVSSIASISSSTRISFSVTKISAAWDIMSWRDGSCITSMLEPNVIISPSSSVPKFLFSIAISNIPPCLYLRIGPRLYNQILSLGIHPA